MTPFRLDPSRLLSGAMLAAVLCAGTASAQAVREGWIQYLPGARVALDPQNNVCTATRGPELDYYARKTDPRGNLIWTQSYGSPLYIEHSAWLAVDSSGNIILTGHRTTVGTLTVKFSANGAVLWAKIDPSAEGYRVEVDAADNVYVAARVFDPRNRDDFVLVKYDPAGEVLWRRQRDFFGNQDRPNSMAVMPDGTVAVTGSSSGNMATVVYDANGNELFSDWRLASPGQDVAFGADGSVYVCGNGPGRSVAALVVALDSTGTEAWTVENSGPNGPFGFAVRLAVDSAGNVVTVGHTDSTTAYMDWLVFKVDRAGNLLWTRIYDGYSGNDEFCRTVTIGPDDSVHVGGVGGVQGVCGPIGGLGTVVQRYDADGNLLWHYENPCVRGTPSTMVVERFGDLVVSCQTGDVVWLEQQDWRTLGASLAGTGGDPDLDMRGYLDPLGQVTLAVDRARPNTAGAHVLGATTLNLPFAGGTFVPSFGLTVPFQTDANGRASLAFTLPGFIPIATELYVQSWMIDPLAVQGLAATDAVVKALQ